MNRLVQSASWLLLLCTVLGCAKKEPKPMRTEPWLAHPSASAGAAASSGAPLAVTRYAIAAPSVLRWAASARGQSVHGSLTQVSGELSVDFADLSRSRAHIQADLASLVIDEPEAAAGELLREAIRRALEMDDGGKTPSSTSFDLTSLEELPAELEAPRGSRDAAPLTRRLRATAVGNLLLHGFRVVRRVPVDAEFGFATASDVPRTLMIRSRAPVVISLETHAITIPAAEMPRTAAATPPLAPREVRVSIELYGTIID